LHPGTESVHFIPAIAGNAAQYLFNRFLRLLHVAFLGEELVRVTYDLLFYGEGDHIAFRKREFVSSDVFLSYADAYMPFADQGMSGQIPVFKKLSSQIAMADIRMFPMAIQFRRVGQKDGNIVQHGGFPDEFIIGVEMPHFTGRGESFAGHIFSMPDNDIMGFGSGLIVLVYDVYRIHEYNTVLSIRYYLFSISICYESCVNSIHFHGCRYVSQQSHNCKSLLFIIAELPGFHLSRLHGILSIRNMKPDAETF
jgi:hypothetical protein